MVRCWVGSLLLLRWWPTETLRFCGVGSKIQATNHLPIHPPTTPTRWPDDDVRDGLNIMAQRHSEGNAMLLLLLLLPLFVETTITFPPNAQLRCLF